MNILHTTSEPLDGVTVCEFCPALATGIAADFDTTGPGFAVCNEHRPIVRAAKRLIDSERAHAKLMQRTLDILEGVSA